MSDCTHHPSVVSPAGWCLDCGANVRPPQPARPTPSWVNDWPWKPVRRPWDVRARQWLLANGWLVVAVLITALVWGVIMFQVAGWWTA